ncbi:cysteine desulfurase [Salisaeta longa]|uniref:cysteine desulfurase n=1 Tax=Salisaeta longa TaxID=503170 RepID=UPI0003B4CE1A|nr:cysteine desulfurase [Salisaeta longa]
MAQAPPADVSFDVAAVRRQFPALAQEVYDDTPLVYLDNAATTQKPQAVIDRLQTFYAEENSNVHRGVHRLSQQATDAYEDARRTLAAFIGAPSPETVVFTRGTTESINLVAQTFGRSTFQDGDEIVLTAMEHHANIVPWQLLQRDIDLTLRVVELTDRGALDMQAFAEALSPRTALVALPHISNTLGTVNPVADVVEAAHARDIPVLVDGAQAAPHRPLDVAALDADFYAFSGHKMFGPTGIGVLYGKAEHLAAMPPYQGGGDMIDTVSFERTTFAEAPHKFEAGTPNIADAIGLAAAAQWMMDHDRAALAAHEDDVLAYATDRLSQRPGVRLVGTAPEKASVLSFVLDDVHPYDAGTVLDRLGIAVRTGQHCTEPLMDRLGLPGTIRASFACYNTRADADRLAEGLDRVQQLFG